MNSARSLSPSMTKEPSPKVSIKGDAVDAHTTEIGDMEENDRFEPKGSVEADMDGEGPSSPLSPQMRKLKSNSPDPPKKKTLYAPAPNYTPAPIVCEEEA